ncbi:MAG: C1 family peptidase [Oscillospiraceae bacterium]|nr:C1 family peptidase [Oscillospiraceae bacterium]
MKKIIRPISVILALIFSMSAFGESVSTQTNTQADGVIDEFYENITLQTPDGPQIYQNVRFTNASPEITDIGRQRMSTNSRAGSFSFQSFSLPVAVDNSKLKYFPEIGDQGTFGSCHSFAEIYYTYTHNYAMKNNIDVKTLGDKATFSPAFNYFLGNGRDRHGVVTLADMPYVEGTWLGSEVITYMKFPSDVRIWHKALSKKPLETVVISNSENNTVPYNKNLIKEYLANGYVLYYGSSMRPHFNDRLRISDNPHSTFDDEVVGELIALSLQIIPNTSHAWTIVGYNDDVWEDINNNGVIDEGELGAFKFANSWGKRYANEGFEWVSYSLMEMRQFSDIYTIIPRDEPYIPELVAELDITTDVDSLRFTAEPTEFPNYRHISTFFTFRSQNREFIHLNGPIALDLTTLINQRSRLSEIQGYIQGISTMEYILKDTSVFVKTDSDNASGTLRSFRLLDSKGEIVSMANGLPKSFFETSFNHLIAMVPYPKQLDKFNIPPEFDDKGPWDLNFNPQNGSSGFTINANRGDIINSSGVPTPIREGFIFRGWYDRWGRLVTFPYFVNGFDSFTARWTTDLKEAIDIELERIVLETGEMNSVELQYRRFVSRDAANAPVINSNAVWRNLKHYIIDGKTYADIGNLLDNSRNVALEIRINNRWEETATDCIYYFTPREPNIKAKVSATDGYTAREGLVKVEITGAKNDVVYRGKNSDITTTAFNENGFIYLPVSNSRRSYILKAKTDNLNNDGFSFETAFKPGSRTVNLNVAAAAKEPNITVNWANDSIRLRTNMEISLDMETWYPVSDIPTTQNAVIFRKDINGISAHDPLIAEHSAIFVRIAATPRRAASRITTVFLGYGGDLVNAENLLSSNGRNVFGNGFVLQHIPAAGLSTDENGNLVITGKQRWKEGTLSIPANGGEYYLRMASTGASRPGRAIKMSLKQGEITVDSTARAVRIPRAPTVRVNSAQDSIALKVGMEVLSNRGEWIKVSATPDNDLYFNPAIGGVSLYDSGVLFSINQGGIVYRRSEDNKSHASQSRFLPLPEVFGSLLSVNNIMTLDGRNFGIRGNSVQFIEEIQAPTSSLKNGVLTINDRRARWRTAEQIRPRAGETTYYIRSLSGSNNASRVLKVKVWYTNVMIKFDVLSEGL